MENVVIDPACFVGLVTSAIEAYNRETNGFLIGAERQRKLQRTSRDVSVLKAAYPIQTAERKVNWVANGNGRAFDRARRSVANPYAGLDLVGGYHSHTGSDANAGLSRLDLDYIMGEFQAMNRGLDEPEHERWLELVLAIRRREYTTPREVRWTLRRYPRKLGARIVLTPQVGYDITLGGFWVYCQKNGRPGAIELAGREEARLHAPWSAIG
jgi:proteasome lid subunit RPN8/RPN11